MDKMISLLPFIDSEKDGFLLDLPIDQGRNTSQGYPFQIVDDGQCYSTLVNAGLKIKGNAPFKSIFLLIQKDHYPISPDPINPMTNGGLDRAWKETIKLYSTGDNAFFIPNQIHPQADPPVFASLFFCKKTNIFFLPPCPECGHSLTLCKDDGLLKHAGLFPYHTSLKRYLFCPHCQASQKALVFYQYSRSGKDPVFVKDRFDLIKDFSRLRSGGSFPCPDCPSHSGCYLTGEKAATHICFFSFYPFYLLFFDAPDIRALDFLALASGGAPEEMPAFSTIPGGTSLKEALGPKAPPGFFFKGETRFFLEVLFLKLSFMEKLILALNTPPLNHVKSRIDLSSQSIWINLQSPGGILPFFWDFSLTVIDFISNAPQIPMALSLTGNRNLNFIIRLWFFTFLANSKQGAFDVYAALGRLAKIQSVNGLFADYRRMIHAFPEFDAQHLFWVPNAYGITEAHHEFWLRTLSIGAQFLVDPYTEDLNIRLDKLSRGINLLKQDVKAELFAGRNFPAKFDDASKAISTGNSCHHDLFDQEKENQAIAKILNQLKTNWMEEAAPVPGDMDEDSLETIILSAPEGIRPDPHEAPVVDNSEGLDIACAPSPEQHTASEFEEMEKTQIVSGLKPEGVSLSSNNFDGMEKTIVLSPEGLPKTKSDFFGEGDDLDKTMVIPPKK